MFVVSFLLPLTSVAIVSGAENDATGKWGRLQGLTIYDSLIGIKNGAGALISQDVTLHDLTWVPIEQWAEQVWRASSSGDFYTAGRLFGQLTLDSELAAVSGKLVQQLRTPKTTILGENMAERVIPFAEKTGARSLPFGATADEWAKMTPQQRWRMNDGALRARINEGDSFRYIGQDPFRPPVVRSQFDLTRSELLRLQDRGIPYEGVSPSEVQSVLGRP
jgi:hypothetical protein